MSHTCHAEGCTRSVPPKMFACLPHWKMVPAPLQKALWAAYRPGQETRKDPSKPYLVAQALCRAAIAKREGIECPDAIRVLRHFLRETSPSTPEARMTDEQVVYAWTVTATGGTR